MNDSGSGFLMRLQTESVWGWAHLPGFFIHESSACTGKTKTLGAQNSWGFLGISLYVLFI